MRFPAHFPACVKPCGKPRGRGFPQFRNTLGFGDAVNLNPLIPRAFSGRSPEVSRRRAICLPGAERTRTEVTS